MLFDLFGDKDGTADNDIESVSSSPDVSLSSKLLLFVLTFCELSNLALKEAPFWYKTSSKLLIVESSVG